MKETDERNELETVSEVMDELRAFEERFREDVKPFARDLVKGVEAFYALAVMCLVMVLMGLWLALVFLFPQYYFYPVRTIYFGIAWLLYPTLGVYFCYKFLVQYVSLRKKYSVLMDISKKLGD